MAEMPELFLVRDPKPVEKRLGGSAGRRGQRERPGAGIVNHGAGMRSSSSCGFVVKGIAPMTEEA
jgi:hypothetical protein